MQNAELEFVRLGSGDVITTSGVLTFTLSNFFDNGLNDGKITNNSTKESWVNSKGNDGEGAVEFLNKALGLTDTITELTLFDPIDNTFLPQELWALTHYDGSGLINYGEKFNTTYKWVTDHFERVQQ